MDEKKARGRRPALVLLPVLAVVAVSAILAGVQLTTIVLVGALLCCPLMMLFMDHGHHTGRAARELRPVRRDDRSDRAA